ncbi:PilZ domain-containing protein, partial [Roseomonas rosulenta]|uniref:PilZ domain-containing protein n=1 Tax=Roseomonas rosulenta TaxID=2748667 RepID=UPI0018DF05B7
ARVAVALPAVLVLPDGQRVDARTHDLSLGGAGLVVARMPDLPEGTELRMELPMGEETIILAASFLRLEGGEAQLAFLTRTIAEESAVVRAVFGRADAWLGWDRHRPDRPLRSLVEVVATVGAVFTGRSQLSFAWWRARRARREALRAPVTPVAAERRSEVLAPRGGAALMALLLLL